MYMSNCSEGCCKVATKTFLSASSYNMPNEKTTLYRFHTVMLDQAVDIYGLQFFIKLGRKP